MLLSTTPYGTETGLVLRFFFSCLSLSAFAPPVRVPTDGREEDGNGEAAEGETAGVSVCCRKAARAGPSGSTRRRAAAAVVLVARCAANRAARSSIMLLATARETEPRKERVNEGKRAENKRDTPDEARGGKNQHERKKKE